MASGLHDDQMGAGRIVVCRDQIRVARRDRHGFGFSSRVRERQPQRIRREPRRLAGDAGVVSAVCERVPARHFVADRDLGDGLARAAEQVLADPHHRVAAKRVRFG